VWAGRACETLGVQDHRAIIWFERLCLDSADKKEELEGIIENTKSSYRLCMADRRTWAFRTISSSQYHLAGTGQAHIVEHTGFRRKRCTTQRRAEADGTSVIHTDNVSCVVVIAVGVGYVGRRRRAQTPVRSHDWYRLVSRKALKTKLAQNRSRYLCYCHTRGQRASVDAFFPWSSYLSLLSHTPSLCCIWSSFSLRTWTLADPLFVNGLPILRAPSIVGEVKTVVSKLQQASTVHTFSSISAESRRSASEGLHPDTISMLVATASVVDVGQ
jgi:hypothetical protein